MLSTFFHEPNVDSCVNAVLHVDDVGVRVVAAREHHRGVGRHLQVKFIENAFALVHFATLFIQVFSYVERLHRRLVISYVPDLHAQVVARKDVGVVCGCEFST